MLLKRDDGRKRKNMICFAPGLRSDFMRVGTKMCTNVLFVDLSQLQDFMPTHKKCTRYSRLLCSKKKTTTTEKVGGGGGFLGPPSGYVPEYINKSQIFWLMLSSLVPKD